MNKPRNDIIDITKIRRPVLAIWSHPSDFNVVSFEIFYPGGVSEYFYDGKWIEFKQDDMQSLFENNLIAWQYI